MEFFTVQWLQTCSAHGAAHIEAAGGSVGAWCAAAAARSCTPTWRRPTVSWVWLPVLPTWCCAAGFVTSNDTLRLLRTAAWKQPYAAATARHQRPAVHMASRASCMRRHHGARAWDRVQRAYRAQGALRVMGGHAGRAPPLYLIITTYNLLRFIRGSVL